MLENLLLKYESLFSVFCYHVLIQNSIKTKFITDKTATFPVETTASPVLQKCYC